MGVYWLEQTEADVPTHNDWLSASEVARLNTMRFVKRRTDWRLGRWTAKHALALYLKFPRHPEDLALIELRPAPSGAPEVFVSSQPAAAMISLSHRDSVAACAVGPPGAELGCDLEAIEPRSEAFVADYFTSEEQQLIERIPSKECARLLALLWSGKESALKALRTGLRLDTRSVTVRPASPVRHQGEDCLAKDLVFIFRKPHLVNRWHALQVAYEGGRVFHGWWQITGSLVRTMVASPPSVPPILLDSSAHSAYRAC